MPHYDAIVLDLPGANAPGFGFAALADEVLLITTNELPAIADSSGTLSSRCCASARNNAASRSSGFWRTSVSSRLMRS